MPYECPEEGNPGASSLSGLDFRGPMSRGGLIDELGGHPNPYGGGQGGGQPPRAPLALPPTLGIGALRGGGGAGGWPGSDWMMAPEEMGFDPRKRYAMASPYFQRGGGERLPGGPGVNAGASAGNGWAPPVTGGRAGPDYSSGGLYGEGPYVQYRSDQPGSVDALQTIYHLLLGGAEGTMYDPRGNYNDYLGDLQGDLNRNTSALLSRNRLRGQLDPNLDPSQRGYAGLLGEASSFGGAQDVLSGARRGLAETNQAYMRRLLDTLTQLQTAGGSNPFRDYNLEAKYDRMRSGVGESQGNWWDPFLENLGRGAGQAATAGALA